MLVLCLLALLGKKTFFFVEKKRGKKEKTFLARETVVSLL